jgi:hypothetical protein
VLIGCAGRHAKQRPRNPQIIAGLGLHRSTIANKPETEGSMENVKTTYEPAHLEWLAHAFDEARRRYAETAGTCDSVVQDVIAHNIVGLAWRGETDFERLVGHSLRDVTATARRAAHPVSPESLPPALRPSHWI